MTGGKLKQCSQVGPSYFPTTCMGPPGHPTVMSHPYGPIPGSIGGMGPPGRTAFTRGLYGPIPVPIGGMGPCKPFAVDFPLPVMPYSVLVAMSLEPIHDVGPFSLLPFMGPCRHLRCVLC